MIAVSLTELSIPIRNLSMAQRWLSKEAIDAHICPAIIFHTLSLTLWLIVPLFGRCPALEMTGYSVIYVWDCLVFQTCTTHTAAV